MVHAFNPVRGRPRQADNADICEFQGSLIYRVSSRMARATEGNLSQNKNKKQKTHRYVCGLTSDITRRRKSHRKFPDPLLLIIFLNFLES